MQKTIKSLMFVVEKTYPMNNQMFKIDNENTRTQGSTKIKVKSSCLTFSHFFSFFNVLLYVNCQVVFLWLASFLRFFISFLRRALYSAWKKIQVQIIAFNKKAIMKLSGISNSQNLPWNLVKFRSEFFLVSMSRIVYRISLVLIVN